MGSWLADYLSYTSGQEAPEELRMWCGILTMGAVLNRKVWLPRDNEGITIFNDFPGQLYIVVVTEPGEGKKSTALGFAGELMKEAGVKMFDGKISNDRLTYKLAKMQGGRAIITIINDELSDFLTKDNYNEGLVTNLIKLFDCKEREYETHSHGNLLLRNVCVTIGAASTPESIGRSIPANAQGTGFLSRLIVVYSPRSAVENPLISLTPTDPKVIAEKARLRISLIQRLRQYSQYSGPFEWERDAIEWFVDWYKRVPVTGYSGDPIPHRPRGAGWPERLPEHLLRVAMNLEVSSTNSLRFHLGSLQAAEQMLREQVAARFRYSLAYIGRHMEVEGQERILAFFREKKIASTEEVIGTCRRYFRDVYALQNALYTLRVSGIVSFNKKGSKEIWEFLKDPDVQMPPQGGGGVL